ncbi:MAG: PQQ-binding-like beta-propeller repeat protein, partial [Verrucomicrobiae bacterium]|nr:PQQ-binding-like beta-propeller repeat protein [Verrucomicrobiae bacterium]
MKLVSLALCLLILPGTAALAGDWPWWRGPNHDGIAEPGQEAPVAFSASENCRWSADLPGRSHGSAAVAGDRVFLAVAEEEAQIQSVMCFDRDTGGLKWKTEIHRGGLVQKTNKKASWASGTPACDGERVFVNFINGDAVFTTALDLDGKQLWRTRITGYTIHQGYGSSPAIHGDLVLVSADNKSGGAVCGLNRKTGEVVWKRERAQMPNYASPVVFKVGGRDQLFLTGTEKVSSFDPLTGETLWEVDGATTECVTT